VLTIKNIMGQNVRKGEELKEGFLKDFLFKNHLIENIHSNMDVFQFSNGFSNLTYLLQIENIEYVLRRPPFGAIKRGHDMGASTKFCQDLTIYLQKLQKRSPIQKMKQ
jgi:aminoglycoside phosphotransferase (APT) family kinase protein